jgi:hypothetical protein
MIELLSIICIPVGISIIAAVIRYESNYTDQEKPWY